MKESKDNKLIFNDDMFDNLKFSDDYALNWSKNVDEFIRKENLEAPIEKIFEDSRLKSFENHKSLELNIMPKIKSIIWATGFKYNYDWIDLNITNERGFPVHKRGVTNYDGFYFMGLQWMHTSKSAQFIGVGEDAEFIVNKISSSI